MGRRANGTEAQKTRNGPSCNGPVSRNRAGACGAVRRPARGSLAYFSAQTLAWVASGPVWLVGSSPTDEVKVLADKSVHVVGYVPDVTAYFNRARALVTLVAWAIGAPILAARTFRWEE